MGEKVNDSQSFEQEDSFKDNYMQSGTTSALSSGTSKRKPIIPTVSIPYGEEEGGLREKFRGFIDKRKEEFGQYKNIFTGHSDFQKDARSEDPFSDLKDKEQEDLVSSDVKIWAPKKDEKYEPEPEQKSMFALAASNNSIGVLHQSFLNMTEELISDKREALIGHHANDSDYESVIKALNRLKVKLYGKVNTYNDETYRVSIQAIIDTYGEADTALTEYIEKKGGAKTSSGMKRLASVKVYKDLLNKDKDKLFEIANSHFTSELKSVSTYNDLLFVEGERNVKKNPATNDKKQLPPYPGETSISNAESLYEKYSGEHGGMLKSSILFIYAKNPLLDENKERIEPEIAATMFLAAFLEDNPYKFGDSDSDTSEKDKTYSPEILASIKSAILSSPVNDKYPFCSLGSESLANSPRLLPYFIDFLKYAKTATDKSVDLDGPPEDEK